MVKTLQLRLPLQVPNLILGTLTSLENSRKKSQLESCGQVWNPLTHLHRVEVRARAKGPRLCPMSHNAPSITRDAQSMSQVLIIHISDVSTLGGATGRGVGRVGHRMASYLHPALVVDRTVLHGQLMQI